VVYKFAAKLDSVDADIDYRLYIRNNKTGKLVSSHTGLVQKFDVLKPIPNSQVNFATPNFVPVEWNPSYYGKLYQLDILFTYSEKNTITGNTVVKTIDWNLGTQTSPGTSGTDNPLKIDFLGASFYGFIQANIPVSPNVVRSAAGYPLQYVFSAGADNLNTYIEVNAPSSSIVQDRPEFSNITNGYGIFSARYKQTQYHFPNSLSMDSLYNGIYTKNLNFQ
jgi:hypothetical protein